MQRSTSHRLGRALGPIVVTVGTLIATACGADPGSVVDLSTAAPTPAAVAAPAVVAVTPAAAPSAAAVPFFGSILANLNSNTAATERGEQAIIGALTETLRSQIASLLRHPRG